MNLIYEDIDNLAKLEYGWNGYDARSPSKEAIEYSKLLVNLLFNEKIDPLENFKVYACPEGDVGGVFIHIELQKHTIQIDVYDDGEGLFVITPKKCDDWDKVSWHEFEWKEVDGTSDS